MSEKVLLVDDEGEFLEALSQRMTSRGMEVTTTTSAREAIKKVEEGSFDAVILDLMMPEMDGLEVLQTLKQKKPEIQVILLTGHGSVAKGIEAMKLGAMDFLEKPADIKELTEKIKKAQAKKMILVEKRNEEKIQKILVDRGW